MAAGDTVPRTTRRHLTAGECDPNCQELAHPLHDAPSLPRWASEWATPSRCGTFDRLDTLTNMTYLHVQRRAADLVRARFLGGALLLATVVLGVTAQPGLSLGFGGDIIGVALFSASMLVFAYGIRGSGSITARRPLGTAALTVLAVWVLLESILTNVLSSSVSNNAPPSALLVLGYADLLFRFAVTLVAVVQIARAGAVPSPWNWAPGWVLAAVCVPWLLTQIVSISLAPQQPLTLILIIGAVDGLFRIGGTMFLGVLAIVLADRSGRTRSVPVPLTRRSLSD